MQDISQDQAVAAKQHVVRQATDAGWHLLLTAPRRKRTHWRTDSVHDATRDADLLCAWLEETPAAGIAVNCGMSGLVSIEDDGPGGLAALEALEATHGPLPPTWGIQARRGRHRLFRARNVRTHDLATDLQLKARNAYIVLPPTTVDGVQRRWLPAPGPIAELPAWVLTVKPEPEQVPGEDIVSSDLLAQFAVNEVRRRLSMRPASSGTGRGTALFAAACSLGRHVHAGTLEREDAAEVLRQAGNYLRLGRYERDRSIRRGLELGPQRAA